jgi:putative oxidoreductase
METLALIGRIVYSVLLIFMGANHFMNADTMTGYAQSKGVPAPRLAVLGSGAWLIVGCLGILLEIQPLIAGIMVAIFLVATAVMIHDFWAVDDEQVQMVEMTQFLKNMVMAAAALALAGLLG